MKQLKCNKCLEEWYVSSERLHKQKACPFCQNSIQEKMEFTNYDSLDKVIYTAASRYGKEIFDKPKKLVGFISDIAPNLEKERRIFSRIIAEYHMQEVRSVFEQNMENAKADLKKLKYILIEDEGLSENVADMLCKNIFGAWKYYNGIGLTELVNVQINDVQFESAVKNITPAPKKEAPIYEIGRDIVFGKYEWTILNINGLQNNMLIIAKNAITRMPYNQDITDTTWENCTLRKWLNDEFYMGFTDEERKRIARIHLKNKDNKLNKTKGGADTKDYIFLLSSEEIEKFMPNEKQRKLNNGTCWWVRSPGMFQSIAVLVNSDGSLLGFGGSVNKKFGVRPAMIIRLDDE